MLHRETFCKEVIVHFVFQTKNSRPMFMGATVVKLVGHPYTQSMKVGEGVGKK